MRILGIETSCDETSAAVLDDGRVLSNVISSQEVHLQFGGVVPELASRAHLRKVIPIVETALQKADTPLADIDALAVTHGPGLVGALLVGVNFVKGLAARLGKPFVGVNHIEGHVYSNFIGGETPEPPFICLLVSGGHTQIVLVEDHLRYRILGRTRDDAVGEAFDKVAKLLDLPYPGGPQIDRLAREGDPDRITFPIGLGKEETYDFSYSGLKTAVLTHVNRLDSDERARQLPDICASFQKAAVAALVTRTLAAARDHGIHQVAIAGGVAANSHLREEMKHHGAAGDITVTVPAMAYCTDNAAMIARAGLERIRRGYLSTSTLGANPALQLGDETNYS